MHVCPVYFWIPPAYRKRLLNIHINIRVCACPCV